MGLIPHFPFYQTIYTPVPIPASRMKFVFLEWGVRAEVFQGGGGGIGEVNHCEASQYDSFFLSSAMAVMLRFGHVWFASCRDRPELLRDAMVPLRKPLIYGTNSCKVPGHCVERLFRGAHPLAKKSKVAKNLKRIKLVAKYRERREELKKLMNDLDLSDADRAEAARKFQALPRDASPTRIRSRCEITGRPRGNYRKFRLSRIKFRELAHEGMLPGITKSSW